METARTPYEEYLRQSITDEKARLDSLYNEFAKSDPIRKRLLKGQIEEALQNIDLLSHDLDKYRYGLSWLREPSRERDEKAEHLPKLKEETTPAAAPAPKAGQPAKPLVASRPMIGKPVGSAPAPSSAPPKPSTPTAPAAPRPTIGTPVGARPRIGTPVGTPVQQQKPLASTQPQGEQKPAAPAPARPVIGTPVKRPIIGTPIGKPKPADSDQQESTSENASS
jgi:hypothetical protein